MVWALRLASNHRLGFTGEGINSASTYEKKIHLKIRLL
jgi:hypothetical protein